jgi:hypothetical protein
MTKRIFLDVDGVLNAVRDNNPQFWEEWKVEVCDGYEIRHALDMGRALQAIFERDDVEVIWLTTWEDTANDWITPLFGWEKFPSILNTGADGWWKLEAVKQMWELDKTPFIWIDDDISYDPESIEWAEGLSDSDRLIISPRTSTGITPYHIELIEGFIANE